MRKSFLTKAFVVAGVMASALALSSVFVFAANGDEAVFKVSDFGQTSNSNKADYAQTSPIELESNGMTFKLSAGGQDFIEDYGTRAGGSGSLTNETDMTFGSNDQEYRANGSNRTITVKPVANGKISFYFYDKEGNTSYSIAGGSTTSTAKTVLQYTFDCIGDTEYQATITNKGCFLAVKFEPEATTSDTYTWKVSTSALTGDFASISAGDFSIVPSDDMQSATIIYEKGDFYTTDQFPSSAVSASSGIVTTTSTDITGTEFKNYTYTINLSDDMFEVIPDERVYLHVEPTVNGNETKYEFTKAGNGYLVTKDDKDSDTTAYVALSSDTEIYKNNYVELSSSGAKICDDSTTGTPVLTIPVSLNSGKYTISGEVTPTNNIGSKWALVNFGTCYIAADASKNVVFSTSTQESEAVNAGALAKGQKVSYEVVFDFDSGEATATVTNGNTTQEFTLHGITGITSITSRANNGNSISAGNDRGLLVGDITILEEASTKIADTIEAITGSTKEFSCIDTANGITYLIYGITEADMAKSAIRLPDGSTDTKVFGEIVFDEDTDDVLTAGEGALSAFDYIYGVAITDTQGARPENSPYFSLQD